MPSVSTLPEINDPDKPAMKMPLAGIPGIRAVDCPCPVSPKAKFSLDSIAVQVKAAKKVKRGTCYCIQWSSPAVSL
jgi:hypothetical protein